MNILIENGRIIDPANGLDRIGSVATSDSKIVAIDPMRGEFIPDLVVDAENCWVLPGLIDLCAYLREPGYEHKGTIESETHAAVRGGFTAVCCPPDTLPINETAAVTKLIIGQAKRVSLAKVYPVGALTKGLQGKHLAEMYSLKAAGCVAVGNGEIPVENARVLLRCFQYAKTHDIPIFYRPQEYSLSADGCVHDGIVSSRLGLIGTSELAETTAVAQLLLIAETTGVQLHLSQISSGRSVQLIEQAKNDGISVTADVALHHLMMTENVIEGFNSLYHCQPPFRTEADKEMLIKGVVDGIIDAVCSQHQPHEFAAKQAPFAETEPGISGIETLLPLAVEIIESNSISPSILVERLSKNPAKILGVNGGHLGVDSAADICIYDPSASWRVEASDLYSKGKNSPWIGQVLRGKVRCTMVDGRIVHE